MSETAAHLPSMVDLIIRAIGWLGRSPLGKIPPIQRVVATATSNVKELARFVKFAMVGALGAIIDFSVLNLLIQVFGFPKVWANTCSFTIAVVSNFTWNRRWSFPESRQRPLKTQLPMFALVNLIGLGINQVVFLGLDHYVFEPLFGELIGYNLAKAIAIIIVLFWNYGVNRIWTYKGL